MGLELGKNQQLLEWVTQLNIPGKSKMRIDELERAIKETLKRFKDLVINSGVICPGCLQEQRKQGKFDEAMHDRYLLESAVRDLSIRELKKNIVHDSDILVDGRTAEVLPGEVEGYYIGFYIGYQIGYDVGSQWRDYGVDNEGHEEEHSA